MIEIFSSPRDADYITDCYYQMTTDDLVLDAKILLRIKENDAGYFGTYDHHGCDVSTFVYMKK